MKPEDYMNAFYALIVAVVVGVAIVAAWKIEYAETGAVGVSIEGGAK